MFLPNKFEIKYNYIISQIIKENKPELLCIFFVNKIQGYNIKDKFIVVNYIRTDLIHFLKNITLFFYFKITVLTSNLIKYNNDSVHNETIML